MRDCIPYTGRMPTHHEGPLGFNPSAPLVVIEGRTPLPEQRITRQTYLPDVLDEQGVQTLYVKADDPTTYTKGLICSYSVYGGGDYSLEHGGLCAPAWRLRDPVWSRQAFLPGRGYNPDLLRQELATRLSAAQALSALGLAGWSVESVTVDTERPEQWAEGGYVFVKPNAVKDVGVNQPGAMARARIFHINEITPGVLAEFGDMPVIQTVEPVMGARDFLGHLGLTTARGLRADCLHALRMYQPLWLPFDQAPAAELRLSNREDVGRRPATELHLLEPGHVFSPLPALRELHRQVHAALVARYGTLGYPAIDYIVKPDGAIKILNVLARALTPNLEGQRDGVQYLAEATADVEAEKLAALAWNSYRQGVRPLVV
jgi:hypothetical protein